jgi:hypothetical protein
VVKDVDHDLSVIEHDPLAGGEAVHRHRFDLVIFFQPGGDLACDRLQLRLRGGRTDDKEIGEGGDASQIEDDDVFGLFIRGKLRAGRS